MKPRLFATIAASFLVLAAILFSGSSSAAPATASHTGPLPIVFVHGAAGSANQYESQAMRFASNGFPAEQIYAFEYDGANIPAAFSGAYNVPLTTFIDAIMAEHSVTQVNVVGHSLGTSVMNNFLLDAARAARVAHYVGVDGASNPTCGVSSATLDCMGIFRGTVGNVGGNNVYFADTQTHVQAATSAESFAAQYGFFFGAPPATTNVIPQLPKDVEIAGRAVNFPANTGVAGGVVEIWEIDRNTGHRTAVAPITSIDVAADGSWGPVSIVGMKAYELTLTRPDSITIANYYPEPFLRSDYMVRLLSSPPGSLTVINTNVSENHSAGVIIRQKEWWTAHPSGQNDILEVTTNSPSRGTEAPGNIFVNLTSNNSIGVHIHDAAASPGDSTLTPLPYFPAQPFQTGIDVFMPATGPADGTISFQLAPRGDTSRMQVINVPNWVSTDHRLVILFNDYTPQDVDVDGILDLADNCPNDANSGQEDFDLDGIGDACDPLTGPPQLAWVGMRVVLENDWSEPDGSCRWADNQAQAEGFWVRYMIQHPSPGFLSTVPGEAPAVVTGPDFVIVRVEPGDLALRANDDCISRVIYESQEVGEVDVTAHVVRVDGSSITVLSEEYDFLVYYMKLEDVTLTAGATEENVSTDVGLTVNVRGWTVLPSGGNCPQRAEAVDSHGGVLPANRCIFPDDWDFLGGPNPEIDAPNLDIWGGSSGGCSSNAAGPFSLLDPPGCGNSKAPNSEGGFREANFPDGDVNDLDAPMPPAEVLFAIDLFGTSPNDSGFLHAADSTKTPWDRANIPAEPWINTSGYQTNAGGNYRWDSFDDGGDSTGLYDFWEIADHSAEVVSCGGASDGAVEDGNPLTDPCGDGSGMLTGGFKTIYVYSDNHGEAQALINGDADLSFEDCLSDADNADAPHDVDGVGDIKQITGFFCELGDVVGVSTVDVIVNYPDKQGKHYPLAAGPVTIEWTWGGIKQITVEQTAGDQFSYIVLHVTDRDGEPCGDSSSLHPVLGEQVDWLLDSGGGTIVDGEILISIAAGGQSAITKTFDPDTLGTRPAPGPRIDPGECQTWILSVSTLLNEVDVLIIAHDPEGDITFDVTLNLDSDNDGVRDVDDNCPNDANAGQEDFDLDGIGDACDPLTGPPQNKDQCKNGGWALFDVPNTFKDQGDCKQYVNTGK